MVDGKYSPEVPSWSVNDMLANTNKIIIQAEEAREVVFLNAVTNKVLTSGYVDLHHIRYLYLTSHTFGAHNSMAVNDEWGILKKIPVSAAYKQLIYDQTVLGMDHLDCSNQILIN